MIEQFISILYAITVALKAPVIVGVLLALVWALFESGVFLREWLERKKNSRAWGTTHRKFMHGEHHDQQQLVHLLTRPAAPDLVRHCLQPDALKVSASAPHIIDTLLHDMEFEAIRRLSRVRIGLRLGPVLGLMGTLIPMGPALMSISRGNLAVMSNDLIIAFSTTVAGLFVGAVCYVILLPRQYWYARDIADIERLGNALAEGE